MYTHDDKPIVLMKKKYHQQQTNKNKTMYFVILETSILHTCIVGNTERKGAKQFIVRNMKDIHTSAQNIKSF